MCNGKDLIPDYGFYVCHQAWAHCRISSSYNDILVMLYKLEIRNYFLLEREYVRLDEVLNG